MTPQAVERPLVSVVIPVRNESAYIADCLTSLLEGSFPQSRLEVFVVDGMSDDDTASIVADLSSRFPCVRLLNNPDRFVSQAMNIGIRAASGSIIMRVDAHAAYGPEYIAQLVSGLDRLNADNVGGVVVTKPASNRPEAIAVAIVLSHPFGVGNSEFRIRSGGRSEPVEVDTVPFGCYRREVFDRIGLYDEKFVRNQDDELNARLKFAGGRIFLLPDVRIDYVARASLRQLARMMYQYGHFKPLVAVKLRRLATVRQLVPPAFVAALLVLPLLSVFSSAAAAAWVSIVAVYTLASLTLSVRQTAGTAAKTTSYLVAGFAVAHISYGFGYLTGLTRFVVAPKLWRRGRAEVPLSR